MALSAAALDAMVRAGASAEMVAEVVKADLLATAEAAAEAIVARRAKEADRKRRQRAALRGEDEADPSPAKSQGLERTERDNAGLASPKKNGPPDPLRKTTPPSSLRSDSQRRREQFAELWSILPKRSGSNPKQPAEEKFYRLLISNRQPEALATEILDGARRFARWAEGQDPQFVPQAITWLNQGRWKDDYTSLFDAARPRAPPSSPAPHGRNVHALAAELRFAGKLP